MSFDRRALEAGSEAHYLDADYYDRIYRSRRRDVRFYADLAEAHGGPVLELGAGTGRATIAMAERGVEVEAIERVEPMLARARERLEKTTAAVRARVRLRRADLRRLRSKRRFPLVVAPFNVFNHLYDRADWEAALGTVRRHLRRGGRLVFDVLVPDAAELARDPLKTYRGRPVTVAGRRYRYGEAFDYDPVSQVQMVTMQFTAEDDPTDLFVTPLAHRQLFPAELEALLHYNGFTVLERFGDFDRGPLDGDSESQIVVARARG